MLIACATIVKNRKVLLVKHAYEEKSDYGYWLLPAGKLKSGESIEEALKREIKEEVGLRIGSEEARSAYRPLHR